MHALTEIETLWLNVNPNDGRAEQVVSPNRQRSAWFGTADVSNSDLNEKLAAKAPSTEMYLVIRHIAVKPLVCSTINPGQCARTVDESQRNAQSKVLDWLPCLPGDVDKGIGDPGLSAIADTKALSWHHISLVPTTATSLTMIGSRPATSD
jgi:hypothetical protein